MSHVRSLPAPADQAASALTFSKTPVVAGQLEGSWHTHMGELLSSTSHTFPCLQWWFWQGSGRGQGAKSVPAPSSPPTSCLGHLSTEERQTLHQTQPQASLPALGRCEGLQKPRISPRAPFCSHKMQWLFCCKKRGYGESSVGKRSCTSSAFKCASRLALALCYSPSQRSPSLLGVAKAPRFREGMVSLPAGGQGKSDLLSATISSTSSVGSSNSPTSTWTGLAPTGSCKRGWCFW